MFGSGEAEQKKHRKDFNFFFYLVHDTLIFTLCNNWKKGIECVKKHTFHPFPERQKQKSGSSKRRAEYSNTFQFLAKFTSFHNIFLEGVCVCVLL